MSLGDVGGSVEAGRDETGDWGCSEVMPVGLCSAWG